MKKYLLYLSLCLSLGATAQQQMTLNDCLESALAHNRTLQNAALDIQMAGQQKKEAYTKYYPQISANVIAFHAFDKLLKSEGTIPQEIAMLGEQFIPMIGMPIEMKELNRGYSASLSIMQPLFTGGQIMTGNKLAALQEDVMKLQLQLKEKDIKQKVTENFWQIAQVKYNLNTLDAADKQLQEVYNLVDQYVKTGLTTSNDLLKVKLHQQELASNRIKLENADRILRLLLAQQVGLTANTAEPPLDIVLPEITANSPFESILQGKNNGAQPLDEAYLGSETSREEYQLALKGVEAEELQVKMERAKLLPTVAVAAMGFHTGMGGLSDNMKNYMNERMTNGLVMGTVSIPISDWWGGSHAIKRQKMKVEQARNTAQDAQEQLAIDLMSSWNNLTEAYKQIEVAKVSVEQAEENLRMCTEQFRAGTIDLSDLLDAETLNRRTHNDLNSARASFFIRQSDFERKTASGK